MSEEVKQPRRREFNEKRKAEILAECLQEGNTVSSIARKYEISPSLLFRWRAREKRGDGKVEQRSIRDEIMLLNQRFDRIEKMLEIIVGPMPIDEKKEAA